MKNFYMNRYDLSNKSINVIPTVVDDKLFFEDDNKRKQIRKQLGISENFVFLYAGGTQKWQNLDLIVDEFARAKNSNNKISLIILTPNQELVEDLIQLKNLQSANIHVDYVDYHEVPDYINAADAGLILRDNSMINYVASPTKVSEYASCNLKLATDTGQFSSLSGLSSGTHMSLNDIMNFHKNIYFDLACK